MGLIYKDGVVIGADTRATAGEIVADKNCMKIHYLAPNIYCCGAGTAADCDKVTCKADVICSDDVGNFRTTSAYDGKRVAR